MRTRTAAAVIALAVVVTAGACSKEMKAEWNRDKQIDKDLAAVTAGGVPGVALVIRDGGDKTRIASGVSNVITGTPMKMNDKVRIGSISKTYVSVVVMQLVAEGKLSLDDNLQQHLPGIVPKAAKITVRQLLSHSSGIPNYEDHPSYLTALMGNPDHVWTPRQLIDMAVSLGSRFEPGTAAEYSNTNYTIAGLMIEKITGQTLAQQFDQRIFRPLNLGSTSTPSGPDLSGQYAHGYYVIDQPPATDISHFSPSIAYSGGGIVSTADDVTSFYKALFEGQLVRADLLTEMMTTVTGNQGEKYGLGLMPRELPCGTVWGHGGNFPGYLMESYVKPGGTFGVTVAYNLDPHSMQPPARDATQALLTHSFCGAD